MTVTSLDECKMSRHITTVTELWREYSAGLRGRPSVKSIYEEERKRDWKKNDSERRFHNELKQILQLFMMTAEEMHKPAVEAAQRVEGCRVRQMLRWKLGERHRGQVRNWGCVSDCLYQGFSVARALRTNTPNHPAIRFSDPGPAAVCAHLPCPTNSTSIALPHRNQDIPFARRPENQLTKVCRAKSGNSPSHKLDRRRW